MEKILERLGYEKCDCPPDYRETLKIVNLLCPEHPESRLTVDGVVFEPSKGKTDLKPG